MSVYLCHEQPDLFDFNARVVAARPGAVLLDRSALHPGGGGQVSDRASAVVGGEPFEITGVSAEDSQCWHAFDRGDLVLPIGASIDIRIDRAQRLRVARLHTVAHILNALVYQQMSGALVTGAQINADGTARMDFDLPNVNNDELRALEPRVNDVIRRGLEVKAIYVSKQEAESDSGLIRSMSVAPPPLPDGRLRVIEIADLDRQACGGTHLTNTGQALPIVITKVENKGRQNRRVRFALADRS
ncbi:MAG: alanyl-tRNA editing protein [Steroidobacteraceae bacterium]